MSWSYPCPTFSFSSDFPQHIFLTASCSLLFSLLSSFFFSPPLYPLVFSFLFEFTTQTQTSAAQMHKGSVPSTGAYIIYQWPYSFKGKWLSNPYQSPTEDSSLAKNGVPILLLLELLTGLILYRSCTSAVSSCKQQSYHVLRSAFHSTHSHLPALIFCPLPVWRSLNLWVCKKG